METGGGIEYKEILHRNWKRRSEKPWHPVQGLGFTLWGMREPIIPLFSIQLHQQQQQELWGEASASSLSRPWSSPSQTLSPDEEKPSWSSDGEVVRAYGVQTLGGEWASLRWPADGFSHQAPVLPPAPDSSGEPRGLRICSLEGFRRPQTPRRSLARPLELTERAPQGQ